MTGEIGKTIGVQLRGIGPELRQEIKDALAQGKSVLLQGKVDDMPWTREQYREQYNSMRLAMQENLDSDRAIKGPGGAARSANRAETALAGRIDACRGRIPSRSEQTR